MPDITEVLTRLRDYARGGAECPSIQTVSDILGLCNAHESLRGLYDVMRKELDKNLNGWAEDNDKLKTLQQHVDALIDQRDSARIELEGAKLQIEDLQKRLASKAGLGIASTKGDSHADIKEKIRQGLIQAAPERPDLDFGYELVQPRKHD